MVYFIHLHFSTTNDLVSLQMVWQVTAWNRTHNLKITLDGVIINACHLLCSHFTHLLAVVCLHLLHLHMLSDKRHVLLQCNVSR